MGRYDIDQAVRLLESRARAANQLCGSNGITASDVDGAEIAHATARRIQRGGITAAEEAASIAASIAQADADQDAHMGKAYRWAQRALMSAGVIPCEADKGAPASLRGMGGIVGQVMRENAMAGVLDGNGGKA